MRMRSMLLVAALLTPPTAVGAQTPALSHSAPKLGSRLSIQLEGAPPGALVQLYFSPATASSTTPHGTLELRRAGITTLASGAADAQGRFEHTQLVPLDPALAESWGHYQALVQDPAASSGWVLSEAVHLRYLGTRLYETCVGVEFTDEVHPAELRVLSLLHDRTVGVIPLSNGSLPFDPRPGKGEPVLTSDLARGAVVAAPDRLVVFDNFRLTALATLALQDAERELVAGLDGRSAVVLEAGAGRILWVDLPTATVTDSLTLPWPVSALWTALPGGREAWVAESQPGQVRPNLRRVDLEARTVLESVQVGSPDGCWLLDLRSTQSAVFTTTHLYGPPWNVCSLSEVDLASAPLSVQTVELVQQHATVMQPLEPLGLVALASGWTGGPGSQGLRVSRLDAPLLLHSLPPPPSVGYGNDIEYRAFEPDGDGFWALHPCCDWDGGGGSLLRFSLGTGQWRELGSYGWGGPYALELARDSLVHEVYLAIDGVPCAGCPTPAIDVFDVGTATFRSLPGGWGPIALHALTVP